MGDSQCFFLGEKFPNFSKNPNQPLIGLDFCGEVCVFSPKNAATP
jgi:hypothetical protein